MVLATYPYYSPRRATLKVRIEFDAAAKTNNSWDWGQIGILGTKHVISSPCKPVWWTLITSCYKELIDSLTK